ncbi:MAG TPA: flagellar basal body-associated FliL family protein [bacterium]|nr:flagellar basal body-associated FliL family protein [bacterium]HQP99567.1 flagellar basal body-associated FliL family protein [bacterium]
MGDPEEASGQEEQPKRGKGKLLIILVVVLVALGAMGAVAFTIFKGNTPDESEYVETVETTSENTFMIPITEPFVVNLLPDGTDILSVSVILQLTPREERGSTVEKAKEELMPLSDANANTTKMPLVSEAIGKVLANKTKQEYISSVGQDQVKTEIQTALNKLLRHSKVDKVIFPKPPIVQ